MGNGHDGCSHTSRDRLLICSEEERMTPNAEVKGANMFDSTVYSEFYHGTFMGLCERVWKLV